MKSKSTVELADLRNQLNTRSREIIAGLKAEARKANENETKELVENKAKIAEIEAEIEDRNNKKNNAKVMSTQNLSLARLVRSAITREELPEEYRNLVNAGRDEMGGMGVAANSVFIPSAAKRAITTQTTGAPIKTDLLDIIAPVYDDVVLTKLGVRKLTGLKGNVSLPSATAITADWASEIGNATESTPSFNPTVLTPNRLAAAVYVSMEMLQQDTEDIDLLLRDMLVEAVSQKLEETVFSAAAAVANSSPAGIFNGATVLAVSAANILATTQAAKESNIKNGKWLINPAIEKTLKTTFISGTKSDVAQIYDPKTGMMDGAEVVVSNKAVGYALADWKSIVLGNWGGITITPTTQARMGQVELVVNSWWDCKATNANLIKAHVLA